jgi:beta-lactamase class A
MKKTTAFSLLISLCTLLILFFFTLTSWSPVYTPIPRTEMEKPESASPPVDIQSLPMHVSDDAVQPLEDCHDQDLQDKLESILLTDRRYVELSKSKSLSIGIVDMHDPLESRFAAINGNEMMYAASLPKIAILLASEDAIECGMIEETPEVKQDMRMMIAKSSNSAATRMFERVGVKHIAKVLQDPCYNLYDKKNGGGLWVGKPYGKGNIRMGDPLKNLSHAASVMQVCKYYYMLAFGQLVSEDRSRNMLQMLSNPELHHKFVSVLDRVAPTATVYRKSGTWENWHADSAMVWDKTRRYIVVALAQDGNGEKILRDLMLKIDTALVPKG